MGVFNARDNTVLAMCWKYDRPDARLLRAALDADITAQYLGDAISDDYYDLSEDAVEQVVLELIGSRTR